jgi:hypothetical protein
MSEKLTSSVEFHKAGSHHVKTSSVESEPIFASRFKKWESDSIYQSLFREPSGEETTKRASLDGKILTATETTTVQSLVRD